MGGIWDTIKKMFGNKAANIMHDMFIWFAVGAVLVAIFTTVFIVIKKTIQIRDKDGVGIGEACKQAMSSIVGPLIGIGAACVAVPIMLNFAIPAIIAAFA